MATNNALNNINIANCYSNSSSTYTLLASDAGKVITFTNVGNITVTINYTHAFPVGAEVIFYNNGGSTLTVALGANVNMNPVTPAISWNGSLTFKKLADNGTTDGWLVTNYEAALASAVLSSIYYNQISDSSAGRTLLITDINADINFTSSSTISTALPSNATTAFPLGTKIKFTLASGSSNTMTVTAGSGATIQGYVPIVGDKGFFIFEKIATNTWVCLDCYEKYTFASTFSWWIGSGGTTSASQNIDIQRVKDLVFINIPNFTISAAQTGYLQSVISMPTRFRPSTNSSCGGFVFLDAGTQVPGRFVVATSGYAYVTNISSSSNFTATTSINIENCCVTYNIG